MRLIALLCALFLSQNARALEADLAAKAAEVEAACGSKVISAMRNTYVKNTSMISCHASGQAVDMSGNSSCIYAHLLNWRGGYSTDYARMGHVHISICAREMGLRFVHGGGRHHHRRHHKRS